MRRSLSDTEALFTFHALTARLEAMHGEIAAQARARPGVDVPVATARVARRLLGEMRCFLARMARNRIVPNLPRGPITWSELSLTLGEARHKFARFGATLELDRPLPGTEEETTAQIRNDLLDRMARAAASLAKTARENEGKELVQEPFTTRHLQW